MSRTDIDLDLDLVATVMERNDLPTEKRAVPLAPRHLDVVGCPLTSREG